MRACIRGQVGKYIHTDLASHWIVQLREQKQSALCRETCGQQVTDNMKRDENRYVIMSAWIHACVNQWPTTNTHNTDYKWHRLPYSFKRNASDSDCTIPYNLLLVVNHNFISCSSASSSSPGFDFFFFFCADGGGGALREAGFRCGRRRGTIVLNKTREKQCTPKKG